MASAKLTKRIAVALIAALTVLAGCGTNSTGSQSGGDSGSGSQSSAQTATPQPTAAPAASGGENIPDGPEGKYDPPIHVTSVRGVTPGIEYLPDQTIENNVWTREFESELGIKLDYEWVVYNDQYNNKINVTMVSGDMPDFFLVNMQQFQTLAQAGQLADLTDLFEKYASPLVKEIFAENNAIRYKAGTVNGRLLGLAYNGGSLDDAHLLYIREDWMKKLGRTAPRTIDELVDLAIAFAKEDPDSNGIDDTYGLLINKELFGGFASIDGFVNGFGGYAYNPAGGSGTNLIFLKDQNGQAIWGDVQPEVKQALGKLAEMFKAGAIHPEFSVMDASRAAEMLTSHKVGMTFGAFWVPTWPINNMHNENPEVDWDVYEIPTLTGEPGVVQSMGGTPNSFIVVPKSSEHPEAIIKILNYSTERISGSKKDVGKYHTMTVDGKDYGIHMLTPYYVATSEKNQNYHYQVLEAFKMGDPSGLDEEGRLYYDQLVAFAEGDRSQWVHHKLWNEGGVFEKLGRYKREGRILQSAYTGAPTPTMLSRGTALRDLQVRTFTEIIMGSKPLDAFDEFVQQWYDQGGRDILEEVNASGQVQ